jgi:3-carboxy-cis,cis-muconate cycloisomerase
MSFYALTASLFSTERMQTIFSERQCLQRMLDVEAALAQAQAGLDMIPATAASAIARRCDADGIDFERLAREAGEAGNLAIPLVRQLTALVAADDAGAAGFVHWGATSQDIIDTGLVLQMRDALAVIRTDLDACGEAAAQLAQRYRDTPQTGRTWLQHALPISFGLKAASWLDGLTRQRQRLDEIEARVLVLQLGGAVGTLASMQEQGLALSQALAQGLNLNLPTMPWHGQRDRVAEVANCCGLLTAMLGKIARDISLLAQTEVGEVDEPSAPGRGGSSTMPHKQNPVACAAALAIANRMPGLVAGVLAGVVSEHERALGGWQAEWDSLPEILSLTGASLHHMKTALSGLQVNPARMAANLALTHGLLMAEPVALALGRSLGKQAAHHLVEAACRQAVQEARDLQAVLAAMPPVQAVLDAATLARLLDPANYLGQSAQFVDRALAAWRQPGARAATGEHRG